MPPELVFIAAVALAVLLVVVLRRHPSSSGLPYVRRGNLLSAGELAFATALERAIPDHAVVCPKVRLADIVSVPAAHWETHGKPLCGLHIDFAIICAATTRVLLVIELDDRTHERRDRRRRDALVDQALTAAGVALLRVRAAAKYNSAELERLIRERI